MESRVSSTDLARKLGDILARVRYRNESFVVVKNGVPVARVVPVEERSPATLAEALAAWTSGPRDPTFADDLERVNALDEPPTDPWSS